MDNGFPSNPLLTWSSCLIWRLMQNCHCFEKFIVTFLSNEIVCKCNRDILKLKAKHLYPQTQTKHEHLNR